jgi:hypothetical protein
MFEVIGSTEALQDAARRSAKRHAQGVERYSQLLTRYGDGKIGASTLGTEMLDLAIVEATRYAEDAIDLGSGYWNWVLGVRPEGSKKTTAAPAAASRPVRRRRARKSRRTSAKK